MKKKIIILLAVIATIAIMVVPSMAEDIEISLNETTPETYTYTTEELFAGENIYLNIGDVCKVSASTIFYAEFYLDGYSCEWLWSDLNPTFEYYECTYTADIMTYMYLCTTQYDYIDESHFNDEITVKIYRRKSIDDIISEAYHLGGNDGYEDGYVRGQNYGYSIGYYEGHIDASDYYESVLDDEYDSGYNDGYIQGESAGYNTGLIEGYQDSNNQLSQDIQNQIDELMDGIDDSAGSLTQGFLAGMWNGTNNFVQNILQGITFSGLSLFSIVSTFLAILVAVYVIKMIKG